MHVSKIEFRVTELMNSEEFQCSEEMLQLQLNTFRKNRRTRAVPGKTAASERARRGDSHGADTAADDPRYRRCALLLL